MSDPDVAFRVLKSLDQVRSVFYLQRAVDHGGRDIRVFVVGGRVLAAMRRYAAADWRTNVAQGGRGEVATPTAREEELALRAAAAVVGGVGLLIEHESRAVA